MKLSEYFSSDLVKQDADVVVTNYADTTIAAACVFALDEKHYKKALRNPAVSAIITYQDIFKYMPTEKGVVTSLSPKKDFFLFHNYLFDKSKKIYSNSISPKADISDKAIVRDGVVIEADVVIEDYAIIEYGSVIKRGAFVGAHSIIGARGMHNTFIDQERIWVKDAGGVLLEEGVQVLSHATIQKPYFQEMTIVGKNSIISLHSNVGHGCKLGENTMVAGNAQLAGYVKVGNNVWIGPSVTVAHGVKIGDQAKIMLGSTVITDVSDKEHVSGSFALRHSYNMKLYSGHLRDERNKG